jgi:threonine/homoserine/homoserine lactone efflux protein
MMVVLAVEAWRGSTRPARPVSTQKVNQRAFVTGLLINLLNPKAYIFFLVVAPRFLGGEALSLANALVLALVSASIATLIHLALVLAGARAHGWLADPLRTLWARRGFAVIMLLVAASFLFADLGKA